MNNFPRTFITAFLAIIIATLIFVVLNYFFNGEIHIGFLFAAILLLLIATPIETEDNSSANLEVLIFQDDKLKSNEFIAAILKEFDANRSDWVDENAIVELSKIGYTMIDYLKMGESINFKNTQSCKEKIIVKNPTGDTVLKNIKLFSHGYESHDWTISKPNVDLSFNCVFIINSAAYVQFILKHRKKKDDLAILKEQTRIESTVKNKLRYIKRQLEENKMMDKYRKMKIILVFSHVEIHTIFFDKKNSVDDKILMLNSKMREKLPWRKISKLNMDQSNLIAFNEMLNSDFKELVNYLEQEVGRVNVLYTSLSKKEDGSYYGFRKLISNFF